ncbi:cation:dicarboxylase symporter family transporter [bacterium]|nr:cation:dicarboxylase symporter family transporter [bacterium]
MKTNKLTLMIFISLLLGIVLGWLAPEWGVKMKPFATMFLNMIKMIIAPLLFSVVVTGIASHGDIKSLGKLGVKTMVYFAAATSIAMVIGLTLGLIIQPGVGFNLSVSESELNSVSQMATQNIHGSFGDFFVNLFPTSIVQAMARGDLLQIVVFSIFFALAICAVGEKAKPVLNVLSSLADIMFKFTNFVMYFAPLGVFGAIAYTIGTSGIGIMGSYIKIILALYLALILFVCVIMFIASRIVRISPIPLMKAIRSPAMLAFSTATSEAALPDAMKIMERFGVPKDIVGFVMPMGYTFNLDGSTLYLAMAMLFSLQIVGIQPETFELIAIMLTLMITSKGIAGVPRVALIVLAGTLSSFGYPLIGIAILLGIDQILDMGRTTVNLIGNCVATVVVAKWENEFNYLKMEQYIRSEKRSSRSTFRRISKKLKFEDKITPATLPIEETSMVGMGEEEANY